MRFGAARRALSDMDSARLGSLVHCGGATAQKVARQGDQHTGLPPLLVLGPPRNHLTTPHLQKSMASVAYNRLTAVTVARSKQKQTRRLPPSHPHVVLLPPATARAVFGTHYSAPRLVAKPNISSQKSNGGAAAHPCAESNQSFTLQPSGDALRKRLCQEPTTSLGAVQLRDKLIIILTR